jgi:diacylglycerol O-acyltransferase
MPLDEVKTIGKALNCSINDVLLSCVPAPSAAGCARRATTPTGKEIRAMVPVNLRPLEKAWQLGNRFGLAPLVLPIGIDNPVERVYAVRQRMNRAQGQLPAAAGLRRAVCHRAVHQAGAGRHAGPVRQEDHRGDDQRAGPAEPLKFCGSTLRQTMFWVPASGDVGVGVSASSATAAACSSA